MMTLQTQSCNYFKSKKHPATHFLKVRYTCMHYLVFCHGRRKLYKKIHFIFEIFYQDMTEYKTNEYFYLHLIFLSTAIWGKYLKKNSMKRNSYKSRIILKKRWISPIDSWWELSLICQNFQTISIPGESGYFDWFSYSVTI